MLIYYFDDKENKIKEFPCEKISIGINDVYATNANGSNMSINLLNLLYITQE